VTYAKFPESGHICGNSFKTVGKANQVKLVEIMPSVCLAVNKAKGGYFEEPKIYFGFVKKKWVTT
jgi:hypothetical protein